MTRIYVSHSSEGANECDVWQHTLKITRAVNCRVNCKYKTKTMFLASYTLRNRFMCSLDSTLYVKIKWMTSNRRLLFLYSATTHLYCWMDRWTHFHCIFRSFLLFLLYHNETFLGFCQCDNIFFSLRPVKSRPFDCFFFIWNVQRTRILWRIENFHSEEGACIWFTQDTWMTALFDVIMTRESFFPFGLRYSVSELFSISLANICF